MESSEKTYEVKVDTGGSITMFVTNNENLFENLRHGRYDFIEFVTVNGEEVLVPSRFMVIVREI